MLTRIKYTALCIVTAFAVYGATKLQLQSPIVERAVITQEALNKPVPLPTFQLSRNIDQSEKFWAEKAGE